MSCILCQGNDFKLISQKDSKSKGELIVCVCNACSMVSQNPIPTEEQVEQYYATEYRQDYKQVFEPKLKHVYRAGNLAFYCLGFLTKNNVDSGKMLDVGAGGGEFTYVSSQLDIEASKALVIQKSWFNYIFKGKGYLKALNRVRVIIQDARLDKIEPKAILEAIVSKK